MVKRIVKSKIVESATFVRDLTVEIGEEAWRQLCVELGEEWQKLRGVEAEHRASVNEGNRAIKESKGRVDAIAEKVHERQETKEIECHWRFDLTTLLAELVRRDSESVVESRAMTKGEIHEYGNAKLPLDGDELKERRQKAKASKKGDEACPGHPH